MLSETAKNLIFSRLSQIANDIKWSDAKIETNKAELRDLEGARKLLLEQQAELRTTLKDLNVELPS